MFDGFIRDHAHLTPRAPAVITPLRTASYAQFNADIDRFGAAVAELGVTRDTGVVSVALDNAYLNYVLIAALARLRIPTSPFDDPGAEVRIIHDRARTDDPGQGPRPVILTDDWIVRVHAAQPRPLPVLELDPRAVGRVMLSSGTTRAPRRIALDWARLQATNLANMCTRGAGRHGLAIPLTTVEAMQGYTIAISTWSQGGTLTGGFGPREAPALMESHPVGLIGCTPAQLRALLAALPPGFSPRHGWRVSVGGARLPAALARETRLRVTPDVRVSYGATESSPNTLGLAADLEEDAGLTGVVVGSAVLDVVDEDGRPVPDGQSGELRFRGDRVAGGYLDDPEATADRFRDGGFLTRDIGRRLPDGRVILEGRVDDRMILGGGRKFMPGVLEDAAGACPGVLDCAAFAVPDAAGHDQCWLAVVAPPGFDREGLARHLSTFPSLPANRFAWIDEIPRNATGKVDRSRLRDALLAALDDAPSGTG